MKVCRLLVVSLLLLPVAIVSGQEPKQAGGPVGIFNSGAEYNEFMGGVKRAAYGEGGNPELQAMIPMLNDIVLNQPVGSTANQYRTTGSPLGLLADASIRQDIEMVDDQYQQIQDVSRDIQRLSARRLLELDFTNRENLVEQINRIRSEAQGQLDAVLLPHQLERLRQIQMQALLRRRPLVDLLTSDPIRSDLDITSEQTTQLREEQQKIEEDLRREIAKLQAKARERLISKLKPNQQSRVNELIGDAFEFTDPANDERGNKAANAKTKEKIRASMNPGK